jgi:hypothetical protein
MNQGGAGRQIVGGLFTVFMGVIVIAGIYQLNSHTGTGSVSQTVGSAYNTTLSSIFK